MSPNIIESENVTVDDTKPRRIQIQRSVNDEEMDDKGKEGSTQKEENSEEEEEEKVEQEESHENEIVDSPRSDTKTSSRWVQKTHLESQIIGDKESGFKTRRKLFDEEQALLSIVEPKTFKKVCKSEDWISAMNDEHDQIEKDQTWELVRRTKDMDIIGTKWIFKNKFNEHGHLTRSKARLVCKEYDQVESVEFEDTFSPM